MENRSRVCLPFNRCKPVLFVAPISGDTGTYAIRRVSSMLVARVRKQDLLIYSHECVTIANERRS